MTNPNRVYGKLAVGVRRDMREKGWIPLRYWIIWFSSLAIAIVAFYVLLTPIWLGLRALAWLSDRRRRDHRAAGSSR